MKKKDYLEKIQLWVFVAGFAIFFGLFVIGLYKRGDVYQTYVFFRQADNLFADLMNVIHYSMDMNPYMNEMNGPGEKAYFPLSYVLCYVIGRCMRFDGYDGTVASMNAIEIVVAAGIMSIMMAVLGIQLYDMLNKAKGYKIVIALVFLLSGVNLFSYERGNLIVLAIIGMVFFLATYDSDNKVLRECGYIALALAAALKGYPALLGILLIYRKEWKEAIRLVLYGLILAFGPFVLLEGGFQNISIWKDNWKLNSEIYEFIPQPKVGYYYFIAYARNATLEQQEHWRNIWKPVIQGLSFLVLGSGFFQKKLWLQVGSLIAVMLMIPSNCGFYCLLYMFPVIILFFNEKKKDWTDIIYLPLFILMLSPYQIINQHTGQNVTLFLSNIALAGFYGCVLIENMRCAILFILEKRRAKSGN